MMGSRGDASAQATAIAGVFELVDLVRNAEKTIPAAIAELRQAADAAKAAQADLDKAVAEHDARAAEIAARRAELGARDSALDQREAACEEREAEIARKQASFDGQARALAERIEELDRDKRSLAKAQDAISVEMTLARSALEGERHIAEAAISEARRKAPAETQSMRDRARHDINELWDNAQAEIAAQREELARRDIAVAVREDALNTERARLSALLKE